MCLIILIKDIFQYNNMNNEFLLQTTRITIVYKIFFVEISMTLFFGPLTPKKKENLIETNRNSVQRYYQICIPSLSDRR